MYDIIFNGNHLDDVMCSAQGTFHHSAVLVLHAEGSSCDWNLYDFVKTWYQLPAATRDVVVLLAHDYIQMPKVIWYDMTRYQLDTRYELSNCLDVVVLKAGQKCHNDFKKMENFRNYEELVSLLTVNIEFLNAHTKPVTVRYLRLSGNSVAENETLAPNATVSIHALPPVVCLARETAIRKFVNGWVFNASVSVTIHTSTVYADESKWRTSMKIDSKEERAMFQKMRYSHAGRYYDTLTQAKEMENHTHTGFHKTNIPFEIYRDILQFYFKHEHDFMDEYYPREFTFWNLNDVDITQVSFNETIASQFSDRLRPAVEMWCRCKIEETKGPGIVTRIRRYPRNSIVRFHVDQKETNHVFGTILHLARNLDLNKDWPLEVIGFDGRPVRMTMAPGEMVMFEASKVIHGRPLPLEGEYYINTFFYYRPKRHKHDVTHKPEKPITPTHTAEL